jgi:hypothetical protein
MIKSNENNNKVYIIIIIKTKESKDGKWRDGGD